MARLSRNILYNLAGQLALLVLAFVAVRVVFRRLGGDALGIIFFAQTLNALLCAVLELGISSAVVREVAIGFSRDRAYVIAVLRTGAVFYWAAFGMAAACIYAAAPALAERWLIRETLDVGSATTALRILGVSALLVLPRSLYAAFFRGLQRMGLPNVVEVGILGGQQAGFLVIVSSGGGIVAISWWFAACAAIGLATFLVATAREISWRSLLPAYSADPIRKNAKYCAQMVALSLVSIVQTQADRLILSKLLPLSSLGLYSFAYSVTGRAGILGSAVTQAAFPHLASITDDEEHLRTRFSSLQVLLLVAGIPAFAAIPFAARPVFGLVFGTTVSEQLLLPATLLAVGFYLHGALSLPHAVSLARGRPDISMRAGLLSLVLMLPTTAAFVYAWGLVGAALSWLLLTCVVIGFAVPRICAECLGLSPTTWVGWVARFLGLGAVCYGAAWVFADRVLAAGWIAVIGAYAVSTVLFLLGAAAIGGTPLKTARNEAMQAVRSRFVVGKGSQCASGRDP